MTIKVNRSLLAWALKEGQPLAGLAGRATGRSTAQALRLIAEAIEHPGEWVLCLDHHASAKANFSLQALAIELKTRVGLSEFKVGIHNGFPAIMCTFAEVLG